MSMNKMMKSILKAIMNLRRMMLSMKS